MNNDHTPTTTAPGPAPGPRGDVEAAFMEWGNTVLLSPDESSYSDAFKAGAEWAATGTGMTFEEWSYTPEAQALVLQWGTFEQRGETAQTIWNAALRAGRSPEVERVLYCAKARVNYGGSYEDLVKAVRDLALVEAGEREKGGSDVG